MENEKHSKRSTLKESIFARIRFSKFRKFWLISRKIAFAKIISKLPIREIGENHLQ